MQKKDMLLYAPNLTPEAACRDRSMVPPSLSLSLSLSLISALTFLYL